MNATPSARYASVLRPGLFEGRVLWVTGGGSGIGRCVAHELASLGARVVISGRSEDKLQRVAAEIAEDGGCADSIAFDIRDEDAVKAAVAGMVAKHGRIDGLVNNAGGQFPAPLQGISKRGFDAVVGNNLTGGFLMAREVFVQSMQRHGGASTGPRGRGQFGDLFPAEPRGGLRHRHHGADRWWRIAREPAVVARGALEQPALRRVSSCGDAGSSEVTCPP